MNLIPLSELAARSGFFDLFLIGCLVFYIAHRIIRQSWGSAGAERLKTVIAYTFYVFGVILLVASLSRVPGCEIKGNKPQVEQHNVPNAQPMPSGKTQVPDDKKNR